MKKIAFLIFIFSNVHCFAIQTSKPEVQIINGRDFFADSVRAKQDEKPVKDNNGKSFSIYKVESGDTWNSIASKFEITYSELRLANKENDKLFAGKKINIPSDKLKVNDPYFQKKHPDSVSVSSPGKENITYHTVAKGQTLFSISKMYNVSVELIKEWNGLSTNSISIGQKLIVGKNEKESKVDKEVKPDKSSDNVVNITNPSSNITHEKDEIVLSPSKKPVEETVHKNTSVEKIKETDKPSEDTSGEKIVFANGRREVNESGKAVCMDDDESTTEKYFALHRTAPVGTIIRVMNKSNSKKIFVKVIGELPDNFENEGVIIKISKPSAEKLGVTDKSFQAGLLYGVN